VSYRHTFLSDEVRRRVVLLRHYFIRLGFVQGWKSVAAPDAIETTFKALERNLNIAAAEKRELALTIPMACVDAIKPDAR